MSATVAAAFPGASAALRERRAALVERWLEACRRSPLRLPGSLDEGSLSGACEGIAAELAFALSEPMCAPGSGALREVEKRLSFAGGALATTGASAFDVCAWATALRDVLRAEAADPAEREALGALLDWLGAVALEGYVTSREEALRLAHRECLEEGTPVVNLLPDLPAAMLLGDPDRPVLESVFGRLLLAVVRVGARAVVLHAAGLGRPDDPSVLGALAAFARHRKVIRVLVVVAALPPEAEPAWRGAASGGAELVFEERFEEAVARALERSGLGVVRRGT